VINLISIGLLLWLKKSCKEMAGVSKLWSPTWLWESFVPSFSHLSCGLVHHVKGFFCQQN